MIKKLLKTTEMKRIRNILLIFTYKHKNLTKLIKRNNHFGNFKSYIEHVQYIYLN